MVFPFAGEKPPKAPREDQPGPSPAARGGMLLWLPTPQTWDRAKGVRDPPRVDPLLLQLRQPQRGSRHPWYPNGTVGGNTTTGRVKGMKTAPSCFLVPFSSTALLRSVSHSTSSHFQPGGHSISSLCRTFSPFCGTQRGSQPNSPQKKKQPRVALTLAAPRQLPSALLAVPTPGQAAGQPPVSTNGVKPRGLHPQPCRGTRYEAVACSPVGAAAPARRPHTVLTTSV